MKIKSHDHVKVLYDSVLAVFEKPKPKEKDEDEFVKTKEGIFVPKNSSASEKEEKDPLFIGKVVAVGNGYFNSKDESQSVSLRVKVGDYVVIDSRNSANNLIFPKDDVSEYRLLREQNVLMIVNELEKAFEIQSEPDIIDSKVVSVSNKEETTK